MPEDNEKFDEMLARAAREYDGVAVPPADAIWAAIEQDVAKAIAPTRVRSIAPARMWTTIGVGLAATLVIGVSVGRWSTRSTATQVATTHITTHVVEDSAQIIAHRDAVTIEHLENAEVFLTAVRADLKSGRPDAERAQRSRELLTRTRLLLGQSAQRSPAIGRLLEDLELMLAEIAAMPTNKASMDMKLLDETMREGNILPRLRATLPAPSAGT